jgi:uncharacterized protein (TIGR02145 family)
MTKGKQESKNPKDVRSRRTIAFSELDPQEEEKDETPYKKTESKVDEFFNNVLSSISEREFESEAPKQAEYTLGAEALDTNKPDPNTKFVIGSVIIILFIFGGAYINSLHEKKIEDQRIERVYNRFIQAGDSHFRSGQYNRAIASYRSALGQKPNDRHASNRITEAQERERERQRLQQMAAQEAERERQRLVAAQEAERERQQQIQMELKDGTVCGQPITDIDGNSYRTALISNQCWMVKNLRVTRYRNGDTIPNVKDNAEWLNKRTYARAYLDNDQNNSDVGNLYNRYAVSDERGLCPAEWKVATLSDWIDLIDFFGGRENAANGIKNFVNKVYDKDSINSSIYKYGIRRPNGYFDDNISGWWSVEGNMVWVERNNDSILWADVTSVQLTNGLFVKCVSTPL